MKIAVIGFSGGGKSTLARDLGKHYGIPVLHLDKVHWLPGWQPRDEEEKKRIVAEFLDANESWVVDGNYSACSYERRMEEADLIVQMRLNRFSALFRAFCRYLKYHGRTREDMGEGCNEKFDLEFAKWILKEGRNERAIERYESVRKTYPQKTRILRSQREIDCFRAEHGIPYKG